MYLMNIYGHEEEEVTVVGKLDRIEGDILVLKCVEDEIQIKYVSLDPYKAGFVIISGNVENGTLVESTAHPIGNDLDINIYSRFVENASKYPNLF